MNIDPNIWGPQAWDFFFQVALSYPKNPTHYDKMRYKQFYIISGEVIPCEKCRSNFKKHLKMLPIDRYLDSSYNLFTWITKMQNKVREMNGKSLRSVDENFGYYMGKLNNQEHNDTSSSSFNFSNKEQLLIGLACLVGLLFIIKRIR